MTSQKYQDKIVSLLDELANVFEDITNVLWQMSLQYNCKSKKVSLEESETVIKNLRDELSQLSNEACNIIDTIKIYFFENKNRPFEDIEILSEKIQNAVKHATRAGDWYLELKNKNLLDMGIISDKKAMLDNFHEISKYIDRYNSKFDPKIRTLQVAFEIENERKRKINEELYEEIINYKN